jgi:hypothetical protein
MKEEEIRESDLSKKKTKKDKGNGTEVNRIKEKGNYLKKKKNENYLFLFLLCSALSSFSAFFLVIVIHGG